MSDAENSSKEAGLEKLYEFLNSCDGRELLKARNNMRQQGSRDRIIFERYKKLYIRARNTYGNVIIGIVLQFVNIIETMVEGNVGSKERHEKAEAEMLKIKYITQISSLEQRILSLEEKVSKLEKEVAENVSRFNSDWRWRAMFMYVLAVLANRTY